MALPMPMPAAAPGLMESDSARGPSADDALDGREDACGGATLLAVERLLLWVAWACTVVGLATAVLAEVVVDGAGVDLMGEAVDGWAADVVWKPTP